MKTPIGFLVLLLAAFTSSSLAQESDLESAVERLPPCAIACLTTAIIDSPCELGDQWCICKNAQLQSSVETCVLRTCKVKDALTTKNVTTTMCREPVRDRVQVLRVVNITFGVISASFVLARLLYKVVFCVTEFGWDDYTILAALLTGLPSTIISDRGVSANGLGRDIWTLEFDQITAFLLYFYVMEVLYFVQLAFIKLSLLFFFLRIFPGIPVRRLLWATVIFDILFGISFTTTAIFQCGPVSYYWNMWDGEHAGKCIDINALGWSNAAISILLDVWMLGIPLLQVMYLRLAWKKKVGVALMFCVGTFVTVVSIIRLQSLLHFAKSTNPTWDQFDVIMWSTIEINVGIMCACMPSIRVILVRLFPKVLGSSKNGSKQYYSHRLYGSRSKAADRGANDSSGMGSQLGEGSREKGVIRRERTVITIKKTFEVERANNDDEAELMPMEDLLRPNERMVKTQSLSDISL